MEVTRVKIKKVAPDDKGLVAFCSFVLDDMLYLGNIAVFLKLNETKKFRLVFPNKKVEHRVISFYYPLTKDLYYLLEAAVNEKMKIL